MASEKFTIEEVEIEDDFQNFKFEEVPEDETDSESDGQNFTSLLQILKSKPSFETTAPNLEQEQNEPKSSSVCKPTLVEDFLRNFLIRHDMKNTLAAFQHEWYEKQQRGLDLSSKKSTMQELIPDIYTQKEKLEEEIIYLKKDLAKMEKITNQAKSTWERLRKERDYHRMHHRRVAQEKNGLYKKFKRLTKHAEEYEPVFDQMRHKYEKALKEKMLMRLEKDKIKGKYESLESQFKMQEQNQPEEEFGKSTKFEELGKSNKSFANQESKLDSLLPAEDRPNPHLSTNFEPTEVHKFSLSKTFKGHSLPISKLCLHPRKDIIATVSDDCSWKLWSIPNGDLIMSGEGHREWVADCDFHPNGTLLGTCSGDGTVKIWDFVESTCRTTFSDHSQAVWSVAFHDCGDFMVSGSMDHTARLWDINSERCRQTFRGHVDSVNYITFQPYSNNILTASGDKTLSLWDLRSGLCIQTFYGHLNSINHCTFNLKSDEIISCDADGTVKQWDCRMVTELNTIQSGNQPATQIAVDGSGERIVVSSEDNGIKVYGKNGDFLSELAGHEESVNSIVFSQKYKTLISAGSDCSFRVWS